MLLRNEFSSLKKDSEDQVYAINRYFIKNQKLQTLFKEQIACSPLGIDNDNLNIEEKSTVRSVRRQVKQKNGFYKSWGLLQNAQNHDSLPDKSHIGKGKFEPQNHR